MSESAQPGGMVRHAPPDPDPLQGTPYRTLGALGAGGMGEVVEAEHVELQRRVVVKLLHTPLAKEPKLVDRMRVEARTLAALAHPNVVAVTDFGWTPAGRAYFVMERLYGRTLRATLAEQGALPAVEAIGYVRQVLAGLSAAHRIGIVHRDVKADNVFLCEATDGAPAAVKVLDFGIAKVLRGAALLGGPTPQYPTQDGVLLGTPRSVAPEQALCRPVDARTDVYGAGILLYTLIVGRGPFPHARDQAALLLAHVNDPPTPPSHVAKQTITVDLDRAVLKALAKRPEDRHQTAEEFSEELGRILASGLDITQPFVRVPVPTMLAGSTAFPAPDVASEIDGPTSVQSPHSRWAAPASDEPVSQEGSTTQRQPWAQGRLFVVALIASTALFSILIALATQVWRAQP